MTSILRNAQVFAPERLGQQDLLIEGSQLALVAPHIQGGFDNTEVVDCSGKIIVPGLIDGHVHMTGGGGEAGFDSRVPEAQVEDFIEAGVTTVLGLLGTDSITRSLENLFAKAKALELEGLSTYMLTGAYRYPSPTICGSVMKDVAMIDKVIGSKIAVSDHRSSAVSQEELAKLATEVRIGGLVSGKAGLLVLHMGNSERRFAPILEVLAASDVPRKHFLPTHCGRDPQLLEAAIQFALEGGNIDLTAAQTSHGGESAANQLAYILSQGVGIQQVTISSDAYGSQPKFNQQLECIGLSYSTSALLIQELRKCVQELHMDLETALLPFTRNVAARMGLDKVKGSLTPGHDADLLVLTPDLSIDKVYAKGRAAAADGKSLLKSRFRD